MSKWREHVRLCACVYVGYSPINTQSYGRGARAEVCKAAWQAVRVLHVVLEQLLNMQERWSIVNAVQHS